MCRMVFVQATFRGGIALVRHGLEWWQTQNPDGAGLAYSAGNGVEVVKTDGDADALFEGFGKKRREALRSATRIAGHVRAATCEVNDDNSHPFLSCDGTQALMHNGVIWGYEQVEADLKKRGHEWQSTTDSEVLLHAIEEWGPEKAMAKLRRAGVRGSANWILYGEDGVVAYSDGSLSLHLHPQLLILASDHRPYTGGWESVPTGTILRIDPDGKVEANKAAILGSLVYDFGRSSDDDAPLWGRWEKRGGDWVYRRGNGGQVQTALTNDDDDDGTGA